MEKKIISRIDELVREKKELLIHGDCGLLTDREIIDLEIVIAKTTELKTLLGVA